MRKSKLIQHVRRGLMLLAPVAVTVIAVYPMAMGWTLPRHYLLESARLSVEKARGLTASIWSPQGLAVAEDSLRAAALEHRIQEARPLLVRDFRSADRLLRETLDAAETARYAAIQARKAAREFSSNALGAAERSLGHAGAFAKALRLGRPDRTRLQKAHIALAQAYVLHEGGAYVLAAQEALKAAEYAQLVSDHAAATGARFSNPSLLRKWRQWIGETLAESKARHGPAIVVYKDSHRLTLYENGKAVRSYRADLGVNLVADKRRAGDLATPEGRYRVIELKEEGRSEYYLALLLDYPNDEDRRQFDDAKRDGRIGRAATLGGSVEIHGEGGRGKDWTSGCVALSNADMADLFARVRKGTPVTIVGGDGDGGTVSDLVDRHLTSSDENGG